ncbi:MAG: SNF2-related protein [Lachnospiraceae bacterium]|nr:SNF2-related protein [Lachnospiraceae bacterium]
MGAATAGPFDTLEDARQTVLAHRPDAREVDLLEVGTPASEVEETHQPIVASEPQTLPREAYAEYLSIKERYPDTLVGFETEGHYEFYGDDARMTSEILGSKLLDKPLEGGGSVEVSGFPSGQWVYYSKKLWSQGENVYLSGEQEDGTHATVKYLSGRDYLPIDATIHIDGREFRIDSVDYNRGMVSLQDMTMAKEARYPIFRNEPTDYVRSLYEEEEPQYDFATEETVFIAIQRSMYEYDDFSGEQMDVIYAAAEQGLNLRPLLNPEFSPAQMQLIADVEARIAAGERVVYDGAMLPLSGHVMTPEEINAARREYHLPLDIFESGMEEPGQEPETDGSTKTERETNEFGIERSRAGALGLPVPTSPQQRINFHITDDDLGAGGPKTKFRANIDAIRLLKELEAENRLATAEEQEVLSRFVGWGGIPQAFDAQNESWASEYAEVRELLTPEEYREARASTLNAFYTSPTVIKAMYAALENMGLRSGNVLEPSCGVGNFMGLVPDSMDGLKMYGVELDSISGRIAGQLYQKNKIAVQGFETMDFPESFFDCTIGNVPFGEYKLVDPKYDRYNFLIHDYFIAKSLDLVRPGGVVAVVTSSGTMDKQNESVRRYLANRADLLGAIRLPNNAFMRNANTGVVADILFFQKRDRAAIEEPEWVHLGKTTEGYTVNSYFVQHPEMVLGEFTTESTQYGKQETTVRPIEGAVLSEQLKEAVSHIHGTISEPELNVSELDDVDTSIPADPAVKNFSFANVDGHVYYRENSRMNRMELPKATTERILGMIEIRNTTQELLSMQMEDCSDLELSAMQEKLNRQYDTFTAQYGLLSNNANRRAFSQDNSYCLLASLELVDEEGNLERKADIFTKRTIRRPMPVTSVDTASEALAVSIGEKAKVDVPFMAQLSGKTEEEVTEELAGVIFRNPLTEQWETSDEYLSGNVREKLAVAREFAANHPEYAINADYLERVQPKDLEASEIEVRLGATWIKPEYIQQFMQETFHTPWRLAGDVIAVHYAAVSGAWEITGKTRDYGNPLVNATYGTTRANAYRLLEDALNLRDTKIYDTVRDEEGKEHRVINKNETMLVQQKQELIKAEFKEWIFRDIDRREDLCQTYNTLFNSIRPREYDGSHIQFVGMTPEITLMQHQKDAVAHVLYGGNTLLAHCVGAGKTFQMIAAGMESKRLGLSQKSLYVVPNHLTEQWGSDFLRLYPGANVLVATKKDFEPANRKKFCSRIATGNYDAVIIGHSQFEWIPLSRERQIAAIEKQIDDITDAIEDAKGEEGSRVTVKQMEKTRKTLETRLERLNNQSRKDDVVTFEQLGVDRLFVDESHNYKNLFLYTKMRNVAGISQTDAQKSSDMFMKCQYLDEITGGRGVTFATGTPVSNSMVELYTIMRYLQYDTLQKMGLGHFDSWAASFGETVTAIELAPEGTGYRAKTRFARFYNLPELISLFKESADVQTADMLNLSVPEAEYVNVALKPSEIQKEMVSSFADRAEKVRGGSVDSRVDNMLKITNDGRKCALDQRLINDMLPDDPNSKVNCCVENAFTIWKDTAADRSTQLIFCDLSTPKADGSFNVYDDVREKLVEKGIPKEEIAFIHEAATETKKAELFAKVRSGQVRILLGSTAKLGAGTNIQDRLIALHHLDCPWKPSDLEQQEGRILRQGNQNSKVKIFRYVTEGTFDAYMWQLLENKQKFISQIMTSKSPVRSAEDVDDTALSYAEIKALATGNPHIKEKMDLDIQVSKLKLLKANHTSQIYRLESDIAKRYPMEIAATKERIAGLKSDLAAAKPILEQDKDHFQMVVGGKTYTDRKEAGLAITAACAGLKAVNTTGQIGEYQGFAMTANFDSFNQKYMLTIKRQCSYTIEVGKDAFGNIQRINNALAGIERRLPEAETKLETLQSQLATAKEEVVKPFPQAAELEEKSARLAELNTMLNMDSKVSNDVIGLDEEDQSGQPEEAVADKPQAVPTFVERAKSAVSAAQVMEDRPGEKTSVLVRLHEKQTHQAERTKPQPAQKRSHGQEI